MSTAREVTSALRRIASPERALVSKRFFKTGKGEYGEGDVFIGVTVPEQREIALRFRALPLTEIKKLLRSKIHEERLTALIILVGQFERGSKKERTHIVKFYLSSTSRINNWDLVDSSARDIVGAYFSDKSKKILYKLARSKNIWERRIAVVATHYFIGEGKHNDTFVIAKMLLSDTEDLIHKATGWMLREAGKKDRKQLARQVRSKFEKQ